MEQKGDNRQAVLYRTNTLRGINTKKTIPIFNLSKSNTQLSNLSIRSSDSTRKIETCTKKDLQKISEMNVEQVLDDLSTNKNGLPSVKRDHRLPLYGRNELPREPLPAFVWLFVQQFNDPTVILLLVAGIVAGAIGDHIASIVLCSILFANALIGAAQEYNGNQGIRALNDEARHMVKIMTNSSKEDMIGSVLLVPGDIVKLEVGNLIPADCRVIFSNGLKLDEACLTGESRLITKDVDSKDVEDPESFSNIVYSGSRVGEGSGTVVVVNTGLHTAMANIRANVSEAEEEETPLSKKMNVLGKQLAYVSIASCLVVFVVGGATGRGGDPDSDQNIWLQMLLVAVSLIAAAVPEGLPIVLTITLAKGMKKMAEKKALMRKLSAAETLG